MVTPKPEVAYSTRTTHLGRLKWIGVGLPLACLALLELFDYFVLEENPVQRAEHFAIASLGAVGVVIFALFMFRLIERAEKQVVRQNHELTAINAVTTAVQGELAVEQIIDAALEVVLDRTGATEAGVVVFQRDPARETSMERRVVRHPHVSAAEAGGHPHLVDIPLAHGGTVVGRMRLHLPTGTDDPDLLTAATLGNIGHQLAASIQIGQLVADLQRRRLEGHGLYDILLRISSNKPLTETLEAVVRHARDLLGAQRVELCLTPATAALLEPAATLSSRAWQSGGVCIMAPPPASLPPAVAPPAEMPVAAGSTPAGSAPAGSAPAGEAKTAQGAPDEESELRITLASPEQMLGELTVVRRPDAPFSAREFGFVHSLSELAVIAIGGARMRERERQGTIVAERERIAREMHDSLAQVLGLIHLQLRALRGKVAQTDAPVIAASLTELADVAEEAYRDVREAILGLRESSHQERSLLESLSAYLERYEHQSGVRTQLRADFDEEPRVPPQAEIHLIRVIQEALTNVRKHAHAAHAIVRVEVTDGLVEFTIEDDGNGFDVGKAALDDSGFGLHAMRERMALVGGTLAVTSQSGVGTRVVARVPALAPDEVHGVGV